MKSHANYKPLATDIPELDDIILSYIPSENLKNTLESIKPNKKHYSYLNQLKAMFVHALKNSYTLLKPPADIKSIQETLLEFSTLDDKKYDYDYSTEQMIQEEALQYVTYSTDKAKELLQKIITQHNQTSKRLFQYLIDAGADCTAIVLNEETIRKSPVDTLEILINNGASYSSTDDHKYYIIPSYQLCCSLLPVRSKPWSSMLIATLDNNDKTRLFVNHYSKDINLTVKTLDSFYEHLKDDNAGCNLPCFLTCFMTLGMFAVHAYPYPETIPNNLATGKEYQLIDIARAKYWLLSSTNHWKYSKHDKEQIKYFIDAEIAEIKNISDCERLYEKFIVHGGIDCVSKPNKPLKNYFVSLFKPSSYSTLKKYVIEMLQDKVIESFEDAKDNMQPKDLLNAYKTILASSLFDPSHFTGGVSNKGRNLLTDKIHEVENYLGETKKSVYRRNS